MSDPVLLLMDLQEGICRPDGAVGAGGTGAEVARRGVLTAAGRTLEAFREKGRPVIFVRVAFDDQYHNLTSGSRRFAGMRKNALLLRSDPSTDICEELQPAPEDPIIDKGCVNPFIGTNLSELLVRLSPDHLVMGGVATNHVVESAARHAADSGYRVVVLEDLCASFSDDAHRASVEHNLPFYAEVTRSTDYLAKD